MLAHEGLFRFGVASTLGPFLILAQALYAVLRPVDASFARLMLLFVVVSIPAGLGLYELAPIMLAKGGAYGAAFDPAQVQALSLAFLELR